MSQDLPAGPGPDRPADWQGLMRDLAATVVVTDAEAYARGQRQLTVCHGPDLSDAGREALLGVADDALRSLPVPAPGHPFTSQGRFTRWTFHPPGAAEQLAAVRAAIEHTYPGHWRIEADDH